MNEHGFVPIKLYLQKQAKNGPDWPTGHNLLTLLVWSTEGGVGPESGAFSENIIKVVLYGLIPYLLYPNSSTLWSPFGEEYRYITFPITMA